MTRTLLAIATDAQGEADLAAGTLVRELEPSGGGWGEMELPPVPEPDPAEQAAAALREARERARILEIEAGDAESDLEVAKEALAERETACQGGQIGGRRGRRRGAESREGSRRLRGLGVFPG